MTKVLIIGTGPLFAPDVKQFNGQALRTWHLTKPLWSRGHDIDLVVLPTEGPPLEAPPDNRLTECQRGNVTYQQVTTSDPVAIRAELQRLHNSKPYECIVAINANAAAHACALATRLPVWADLNGYLIGEAQTRGRVYESDDQLKHFWDREKAALRRADRFSAVSHKQMYATLGELGAIGRLNRFTCSHPFLSVIPNAAYEEFLDPSSYPTDRHYRGILFPGDAFAILWSGGFNTWTDTRTLAAALSIAMEQEPKIHLVVTGGHIPGHDERTYTEFLEEMSRTGFIDRCHLLGWVETQELFPLYKECDVGINIDSLNYETMFGARNRLTNLMAAGLTIVTTVGTEISEIIDENRLGYTVRIGDVQGYADTLVDALRKPSQRRAFAARAKNFCVEHFSYDATTQALQKWVASPSMAPDNRAKGERWPNSTDLASHSLNPLEEHTLRTDQHDIDMLLRAKSDLDGIRSKRLYRLYKRLFS